MNDIIGELECVEEHNTNSVIVLCDFEEVVVSLYIACLDEYNNGIVFIGMEDVRWIT